MSNNSYNSDWDVYFCYIEDMPAFMSVDLGIASVIPLADKPTLLEVVVGLQTVTDNGFPENEEWAILEKIEDAVVSTLEAKLEATFVGKTLNNGKRSFYLYTGETLLFEQTMEAIIAEFPQYRIAYQMEPDEEWSIYKDLLYPDEESLQKIYNNRILLYLQEQGDQPFIPRLISYWLYFSTKEDSDAFSVVAAENAFEVVLQEKLENQADKSYKLVLAKVDTADEDTINETTISLMQLAEQYKGEFDGWETQVISENS